MRVVKKGEVIHNEKIARIEGKILNNKKFGGVAKDRLVSRLFCFVRAFFFCFRYGSLYPHILGNDGSRGIFRALL